MEKKKSQSRRRRILRRILITLLLLLIAAGACLYGYTMLKQEYTVTYDSYTASIGSISNALSFSGNLSLIDNATYSASSNSEVRKVYVQAGQDVKEGDKLIRLQNGETIEAGFDGRVNAVHAEEGDEVYAGEYLVQVADFTHMKVNLRVDEYDIADVAVGQKCTVTATATEKRFESEIATIDYVSASGGNVAYYSAVCYVDVDEGIYPGMQVTVSIPQEEAMDVVVLKMDALSFDRTNSAFVYMKNEAGELEEVPVEVGVSNGNYVEIKSGVKDGDEVFVEAKVEAANAVSGLLSGLFGGQQFNMGGGSMPDFSSMGGGSMPDFSSMGGGSMPDFSNMGGGSMPNMGGSSSGRGNTGGSRGQMGGGGQ